MRIRSLFIASLITLAVENACGQTVYSAADIGSLSTTLGSSNPTSGNGINNAGTVVGSSYVNGQDQHVFSYSNGKMTDLTPAATGYNTANAINNLGAIVGQAYLDNNQLAYVYSNGTLHPLAITSNGVTLAGYCSAYAINDNGIVCGAGYENYGTYSQPYDTFVYDSNTNNFCIISNSGGTTAATGINSSNVMCGNYALNYSNFFFDAFICTYFPATNSVNFTGIAPPGQAWVANGVAINNAGVVVGYHSSPNTNQQGHAFSWTNGTYTELGILPGGSDAAAQAINNLEVIVGGSGVADGSSHAFVYSGGVMTDLNLELSSAIGTVLKQANAINDLGQIVAIGENGHTYLLTPTPSLLMSLSISPNSVLGSTTTSGTITLKVAAKSDLTVLLNSSNPGLAYPVVSSIKIAAGYRTATFKIVTTGVTSPSQAVILASVNGSSVREVLKVDPVGVQSVSLKPSNVVGKSFVIGVVTLDSNAPPGGLVVTMTSSNPSVAFFPASTVTVPSGYSQAAFDVFTTSVTKPTRVTITASANGVSSTTVLTINP